VPETVFVEDSVTDYREYYLSNFEGHRFRQVQDSFLQQRYLSAFDFFCIIVWKANRVKSKVAKKLLKSASCNSLDKAVRKLTEDVANAGTAKDRMRALVQTWKFRLPMASAILTILYPEEFTVYDVRVTGVLDNENGTKLGRLGNRTDFESLWSGYEEYVHVVKRSAPANLSLRDKDRYLWGKSFFQQLQKDVQQNFSKRTSR
jgi:hypothetical protein